jgi:hypothetical protein
MKRVEIKQGQYFVTCIDTFMSDWGRAEGLSNKLIILCDNFEEAQTVAQNAKNRGDQRSIKIHSKPPTDFRTTKGPEYITNSKFVQIKDKEDMPHWFKPGYFKKEK